MKKVLIILCCVLALQSCNKDNTKNETINGFDINWTGDLGKTEKDAIRDMISNMVKVESGTFHMGAQKDSMEYYNYDENATTLEGPVHEVTVSEFYINKYEVTQLLWEAVMGATPNKEKDMQWEKEFGKGDNYPAYRISFDEIETFIGKLNEYTGLHFELPSEAQWEFAARGGKEASTYDIINQIEIMNVTQDTIWTDDGTFEIKIDSTTSIINDTIVMYEHKYAGSSNIENVAWIDSNSNQCSEVGKKSPNVLGLYDMSGNVWEMTSDWYYNYSEEAVTDPVGEEYNEGYKVFRGGSWYTNEQSARVTARSKQGIHYRDFSTGFRLVIK